MPWLRAIVMDVIDDTGSRGGRMLAREDLHSIREVIFVATAQHSFALPASVLVLGVTREKRSACGRSRAVLPGGRVDVPQ